MPSYINSILPGFQSIEPAEPLTAEQIKVRLRIDPAVTTYDTQFSALITAARQYIQRYTKRAFLRQSIVQYWDEWPADSVFVLANAPLDTDSIGDALIQYYDNDYELQTFSTGYYRIDAISSPARILILPSAEIPDLPDGLGMIRFTAYYGSEGVGSIPAPLIECIYQLVGFWFESSADQDISDLHYVHAILKQYVVNR